jgi:hypothetical protein
MDVQTGQCKQIFIPTDVEMEGSFKITEKTSINKESEPCNTDPVYKFTTCISNYIFKLTGCTLDWPKFSNCSTRTKLIQYQDQMRRLLESSWKNLTMESCCYSSCRIKQFEFIKQKEELATWKRDWSSAFYLQAETTFVKQDIEFWVFDMSDCINGIGGALGLFLGWSLLCLLQNCAFGMQNMFSKLSDYLFISTLYWTNTG